jgi:hypothetical protein
MVRSISCCGAALAGSIAGDKRAALLRSKASYVFSWARMIVNFQRFLFGFILAIAMAFAPPTHAAPKKQARAAKPSMTVVLVRSSETGREPVCAEWIAADGDVTAASPGKFRSALKQAGLKGIPIVIHSYGGSVEAALAIGRMIRKNKSPVIVGNTIFTGCTPYAKDACKPPKEAKGRYAAAPSLYSGYCTSACGLILAGGAVRMSVNGNIGTHQIVSNPSFDRIRYWETYRVVNGRKKVISRKIVSRKRVTMKPTTKLGKSLVGSLRSYLESMGVSASYYDLFAKAPPEGMYFLTPAEMKATRIVTADPPSTIFFRKELCAGAVPALNCVSR